MDTAKLMNILLPFYDDSSLMAAARLAQQFESNGSQVFLAQLCDGNEQQLSDRQLTQNLGNRKIDFHLKLTDFFNEEFLSFFQGITTNRIHRWYWRRALMPWSSKAPRPALVAFSSGLEFSPLLGNKNRCYFDGVFFNSPADLKTFESWQKKSYLTRQSLFVGNPFFVRKNHLKKDLPTSIAKGLCFFAQAQSPSHLQNRIEVLKQLLSWAQQNPQLPISVKLRQTENENIFHARSELYSYPWILEKILKAPQPNNFHFIVDSIENVFKNHNHFISCSSTATIEAAACGASSYFWSDFSGAAADPMAQSVKKQFAPAQLLVTTEQITKQNWPQPEINSLNLISDNYLQSCVTWLAKFHETQKLNGSIAFLKPQDPFFSRLKKHLIDRIHHYSHV